jgi:hypothetical protein
LQQEFITALRPKKGLVDHLILARAGTGEVLTEAPVSALKKKWGDDIAHAR